MTANGSVKRAMTARAFAIADRWARDFIEGNGVPVNDQCFAMANLTSCEVCTLGETTKDFQDAAHWLLDRSLAELIQDENGDLLILKEEP